MKNLNKFTKAELISKFKKLDSKNSNLNNNQPLFSKLIEFILWFKGLILKITLITILIRTFRKYSLFSKLFRFANWIILTIFGISVIDNFPSDFFKEFRYVLAAIISYFSNTTFYSFIASIFKAKEEIPTRKVSIREEPVGWESSGNESDIKQSKGNSKISEWLKPEPEIKEQSNNGKYLVIAGILILGCLSWYYWDEVRTVGPIVQDWFRRIRPRGDDSGGNNPGMNQRNIQSRLDDIFNNNNEFNSNNSPIELIDNTQNVASSSKLKLDSSPFSDNSIDHYFSKPDETIEPQLTGLRPITGQDFTGESTAVVQEINTFLDYYDKSSFPKAVVGAGIYKLLRDRLLKLSDLRSNSYEHLIQDDEINNKIERFLELENQFYTQPNSPDNEVNNFNNQNIDNQNVLETQSNTYEEVAAANIETRMAWSDRATPSVHSEVLSPASNHENLDNNNQISNLIDNVEDLNDNDLMDSVQQTFTEDVGLKIDTSDANIQSSSQVLPDINIDSNSSSDNSMNQYFTKPEVSQQKVQSSFSNLLDSIRARRDDSNVVGSPQITQLGLSPKLSPLNTKPSISNLLDDTAALFEDEDDIASSINNNFDKGKAKEVVDENLLSAVSNSWDKIETNIQYGEYPYNIKVDLKFDELWTRISKFRFVMNSGQLIDFDFDTGDATTKSRTFDLSSRIQINNSSKAVLNEIILFDLDDKGNSIWKK